MLPMRTPPTVESTVQTIMRKLLLRIFVWIGARLFRSVIIYSPPEAEDDVWAVHFGVSEEAISQSCRDLSK